MRWFLKYKRKKITLKAAGFFLGAFVALLAISNFAFAQANALATGKNPDFDANGIVGYPDFFLFADNWGRTGDTIFDLNRDNRISLDDFFIFADYFGKKVEIAAPETVLTACQEITAPGNYVLQADLESLAGQTCLDIHDANNVRLNCAGHYIGHLPNKTGYNATALKIRNANNFSISGCEIKTTIPHTFMLSVGLPIINSNNGAMENNTIGKNFPIFAKNSSNLKFRFNKVNSYYEQENSSNNLISDNEFKFTNPGSDPQASAVVLLYKGSHNTVTNNKINGGWNGFDWTKKSTTVDLSQMSDGNFDKVGADDGIVLNDESDDIISSNFVEDNFDCGIETIGFIHNSTFTGNHTKNSPICGIGGWYDSKWRNNTVTNNTAEKVPLLFLFNYTPGFKQNDLTPIYFENNTFRGNKFIEKNTKTFGNNSAKFDFFANSQDSKNIFLNNTFSGNDFNKNLSAPFIFPKNMAVDGGGNTCGKPGIFLGLSDLYEYPLKCTGIEYCLSKNVMDQINNELKKLEADRNVFFDLNADLQVDSADLSEVNKHLCPDAQ